MHWNVNNLEKCFIEQIRVSCLTDGLLEEPYSLKMVAGSQQQESGKAWVWSESTRATCIDLTN